VIPWFSVPSDDAFASDTTAVDVSNYSYSLAQGSFSFNANGAAATFL